MFTAISELFRDRYDYFFDREASTVHVIDYPVRSAPVELGLIEQLCDFCYQLFENIWTIPGGHNAYIIRLSRMTISWFFVEETVPLFSSTDFAGRAHTVLEE